MTAPERAQLAGGRRVGAEEAAGEPHRAQGQALERHRAALAHARELEAPAPEVGHRALADRQAPERGLRAEPRLFPAAQDPHAPRPRSRSSAPSRRSRLAASRTAAVATAMMRGFVAVPHAAEEAVRGAQGGAHRVGWKLPALAAAEARLDALLPEDAEADAGVDAGEEEAGGVGSEVEQRHQLCHGGESRRRAPTGQITGLLRAGPPPSPGDAGPSASFKVYAAVIKP